MKNGSNPKTGSPASDSKNSCSTPEISNHSEKCFSISIYPYSINRSDSHPHLAYSRKYPNNLDSLSDINFPNSNNSIYPKNATLIDCSKNIYSIKSKPAPSKPDSRANKTSNKQKNPKSPTKQPVINQKISTLTKNYCSVQNKTPTSTSYNSNNCNL
jgi:hypothetical protein